MHFICKSMLRKLCQITLAIAAISYPADTAVAERAPTAGLYGALGLNTVPNARMEKTGTVRFSASTSDPYIHGTLGIQLAEPFYVGLRQTALVSDIFSDPDRFFPGVDLKLRLLKENAYQPEIALGLQSAIGHKRMAGETLTLSKGYKDFDFTGGIAWGRLGSAAHISNPLKSISNHFGEARTLDGETPNMMDDWFTGEDVGFFAGIEYFTPLEGLSLKADWGADRYIVESQMNGFEAPDPWSLGLAYQPKPWIDLGAALIGGEKLYATMSFRSPVQKWPDLNRKKDKPPIMRPYRTGIPLTGEMRKSAIRDGLQLHNFTKTDNAVNAVLPIDPSIQSPLFIGRAARHMANHAGPDLEALSVTPSVYGLKSRRIVLNRRDLERAMAYHEGSPQEIWRNAEFRPVDFSSDSLIGRFLGWDQHIFNVAAEQALSLSEDDNGILYRTGLLLEQRGQLTEKLWTENSARIDVTDNVHRIRHFRLPSPLPVRSNIDDFADRTFSVERSYIGWLTTLKPDLHVSLKAGYLEEMYAGLGGEVLYRPFGKTFAIGAEGWWALKRDPYTDLNLGLNGDRLLTGHLQAWYEIPGTNMTLQARVGRYLAEDLGATLALKHRFDNGATLEAFATATDQADFDVFGSQTHLFSGLKMRLPLGNIPHLPVSSDIRIKVEPFGRDTGQSIDTPMPLYELTEPLSYRHIANNWNSIIE